MFINEQRGFLFGILLCRRSRCRRLFFFLLAAAAVFEEVLLHVEGQLFGLAGEHLAELVQVQKEHELEVLAGELPGLCEPVFPFDPRGSRQTPRNGQTAGHSLGGGLVVVVLVQGLQKGGDGGVVFGEHVHLPQQGIEWWQGGVVAAFQGLGGLIHESVVKEQHFIERERAAVMHVGGGVPEIAQSGGAELVAVRRAVAQADGVEFEVGEHGAVVAEGAFGFLEDLHAVLLGGSEGAFVPPHEAIKGRVRRDEGALVGGEGAGDTGRGDLGLEEPCILGDGFEPCDHGRHGFGLGADVTAHLFAGADGGQGLSFETLDAVVPKHGRFGGIEGLADLDAIEGGV